MRLNQPFLQPSIPRVMHALHFPPGGLKLSPPPLFWGSVRTPVTKLTPRFTKSACGSASPRLARPLKGLPGLQLSAWLRSVTDTGQAGPP